MKSILVSLAALVLLVGTANATQPECTGDRHYDSEANGCCPNVVECPVPTTSTTLPNGECEVCEPVLPCPLTPPCPGVTCECKEGDNQLVFVDRCPAPEPMEVCKVRRNGTVVCPRSKKARKHGTAGPRKLLVPRSIVDQISDINRLQ